MHMAYLTLPDTLRQRVRPPVGLSFLDRHGPYDRKALARYRQLLTDLRPTTLLCMNLFPLLFHAIARPTVQPAVHVSVNITHFLSFRTRAHMLIYRPLLRRATSVIYGCAYQQRIWEQEHGLARANAQVIHNGVDLERFTLPSTQERAALRLRLGLSPQDTLFGMVAQFRPEKDHVCLIRALALLTGRGEHVHAALVGTGENMHLSKELARNLGVSERVHFLGYMDDVRPALYSFDAFVLTSVTETFSNAALEAMAAEKPVVLSDSGGALEMVREGQNGFVFPGGDAEALAERLTRLLDPDVRLRMGEKARKIVEQEFSMARMEDQYRKALYAEDQQC